MMRGAIRRIVTGHDAQGRAVVLADGPAPFVHSNPHDPDFRSTDIWRTFASPAPIVPAAEEPTLGPRRQLPAPAGTVLRINVFPPEPAQVRAMSAADSASLFANLGNEKAASLGARHPLMHRTATIDYAIILSGRITMLLDEQDVELRAGDIVVQCGTNHAWSNRSDDVCVIAFILIDGAVQPDLARLLAPEHQA